VCLYLQELDQLEKMVDRVICSSAADFDATLSKCEVVANGRMLFMLFTGSKNTSTGLSWCSDCVTAEPIIDAALEKADGGCVLIVCSVDRASYRTPEYQYRTDPRIKLTCVPTLMKWNNGKALLRLNDSQSQIAELVQDLVEA
jgi:thiol-disulfide isomerase/thioredoxin